MNVWITRADTDRNGAISVGEMVNDAARFMATLDLNGNAQIDVDEMRRYEQEIAPSRVRFAGGMRPTGSMSGIRPSAGNGPPPGGRGGGGSPGGGPPGGGGGPPGGGGPGGGMGQDGPPPDDAPQFDLGSQMMSIPQPVAMADLDINGLVTADEFKRTAIKRFAAYDANANGLVEVNEVAPSGGRRRR